MEISGGLPQSICVRDIAVQERDNDIVIATFGRGFYIIDDYSVLQTIKKEDLEKKATIFPMMDGLVFYPSQPYGHKGKSFQGESFYLAENPPIGATIRYYVKDDYKSLKDKRKELEKEKIKNNQAVAYPSKDSMRLEDNEEAPYTMMVITDEQGNDIRKIKQSATKGMKQVVWDGRLELTSPVSFYTPDPNNPYESDEQGPLALPGKYFAQIVKVENGVLENLSDKVSFNLTTLSNSTLPEVDKAKLLAANKSLGEFRRVVLGTNQFMGSMNERIKFLKAGIQKGPSTSMTYMAELKAIEKQLKENDIAMHGDRSLEKREFETLSGIVGSVETIVGGTWNQSLGMTGTFEEKLTEIRPKFKKVYDSVYDLNAKLTALENKLEELKLPSTPGRLPKWNEQ